MEQNKMLKKIFYALLPLAWMGIIYYSSSLPYEKQDMKPFLSESLDLSFLKPYVSWIQLTYHEAEISVQTLGVEGLVEFFIRKGAHFFVFFILMILFFIACKHIAALSLFNNTLVSFMLSVAYAGIDEYHQAFTPNRTPYLGDVVLDGCGALTAGICICIVSYFRSQKRKKMMA